MSLSKKMRLDINYFDDTILSSRIIRQSLNFFWGNKCFILYRKYFCGHKTDSVQIFWRLLLVKSCTGLRVRFERLYARSLSVLLRGGGWRNRVLRPGRITTNILDMRKYVFSNSFQTDPLLATGRRASIRVSSSDVARPAQDCNFMSRRLELIAS